MRQVDSTTRPDEEIDDTHGGADQAELSNMNLQDNVLVDEEQDQTVQQHCINPCIVEIEKGKSGILSTNQLIAGQHDHVAVNRDNSTDAQWLANALQYFRTKNEESFNFLMLSNTYGRATNLLALLKVGKKLEEDLLQKQALGVDVSVNHGDPLRVLSWSGNKDTRFVFLPNKHVGDAMKKFITLNIEGIPEYDGVEDPEVYGEKCKLFVSNIMEKRFKVVEPHLTKYQRKYTKKSMATIRWNIRKDRTIDAKFVRSTKRKEMGREQESMTAKRTRTADVLDNVRSINIVEYLARTDSSFDLVDRSTTCIFRENRIVVEYLLNFLREDALRWMQEECPSDLE